MHRFFITNEDKVGAKDFVISSDEIVHQMFSVLRFRPNDEIVLLDGSGDEFKCVIADISKKMVSGKVLKKVRNEAEPLRRVCLYQSLLKNTERFEWVLQKGTEIGVSEFVPLISARCERPVVGKIDRLERIIKEAAEQSGRGKVPELKEAVKFKDVLGEGCASGEIYVIADPLAEMGLRELVSVNPFPGTDFNLKKYKKINLFIGPEGGFTSEEVGAALESGFVGVNLGARILRSETAGVVMGAMVLV